MAVIPLHETKPVFCFGLLPEIRRGPTGGFAWEKYAVVAFTLDEKGADLPPHAAWHFFRVYQPWDRPDLLLQATGVTDLKDASTDTEYRLLQATLKEGGVYVAEAILKLGLTRADVEGPLGKKAEKEAPRPAADLRDAITRIYKELKGE